MGGTGGGGAADPTAKPAAFMWGNVMCFSRTVSVGCFVSLTILLSLYYIATEDARRYLVLPAPIADRFMTYDSADVPTHGYLVNGPRCQIPNVDPYDKEVRRFIHSVAHISCTNLQPLTYVLKNGGVSTNITATLVVDEHVVSSYSKSGVQCCYSNVTRGFTDKKPDDTINISTCKNFKDRVNLTEPFVIVKCVTRNRKKEVYKNAHAFVNVPPKIKKRIEANNQKNDNTKALSVLMVGIDSISRLNSIRTMPRTLKYLDVSGWVELKGYNKIADNTFPNLMAILTGIEGDASYNQCLPTKVYRLDNCSFIWKKYQNNGYVTSYAEDAASISTFNYNKVGFANPPTDFYFRPLMKAAESQLKLIYKYSLKYCVGPVTSAERILSYAKDFATTFVDHPNFGLYWMNTFSHNDLNMPSGMDNAMLQFFQELSDRGVNENTIIVFFSDHGIRFGKIRDTKIGWLEERLPFIYIYVPKWFRERFPLEFKNLQINANRLTTPYDLHMTLQDILVLSNKTDSVVPSSGCPKCQSLFTEVSNNRSCEDAAISPHWCMCTSYKSVPLKNETVQQAAAFVVLRVNKYIDDANEKNISRSCAKLALNKIIKAQIGTSWYKNETYYLMTVEAVPGLMPTHGYLVNGPRCQIPNVDPFDKQVRRFIHSVAHISCTNQQPLTYVLKNGGVSTNITATLVVDEHVVSSYSKSGVQCCYSNVTRGLSDDEPDNTINISTCKDFKDRVNLTEPFVIVKCVTRKKKEVYKNAHAFVNVPPKIKKRLEANALKNDDTKALSVMLIGIDSISRLNSIRTMPRTLKYLDVSGWIELKGYNKIADNTFPNLMAILTGIEGDATYYKCKPTEAYRLDNCSFIWTKYRNNGYVTSYAEDAASISTFNYEKVGFANPPTDFYFRPLMKAAEDQLKIMYKYTLKYCVGPVIAAERILSYAKDFSTTFLDHPNFGLYWMNTFSHNDLNMPSGMDNAMLKFFQELSDRGVNENTIIVFFSDHGMRFGKIRDTKIGWIEERLPFIYIYIPKWFREMYPSEFENLQINANRLTTPYDLHMTLQDILVLSNKTDSVVPSSGCPKCQSLFTEVSNNRSCEDAAISPHWCMCTSYKSVPLKNETVQQAAAFVVLRVNKYIDDAYENNSHSCAKLALNKIIKAQIGTNWYKNETYYLMTVEAVPGKGKFEATLSLNLKDETIKNKFTLHSSISRLDSYADQSYCINNDSSLKKYCYCR